MISNVEEKTNGLRNDIAKESKNRFDSIEHPKACLEVSIIQLTCRMISLNSKRQLKQKQEKEKTWTNR